VPKEPSQVIENEVSKTFSDVVAASKHSNASLGQKEVSKESVVSKGTTTSKGSLPGPAFAKNPFVADDVESEYRLDDTKQISEVEFKAQSRDHIQEVFTSSPAERERIIRETDSAAELPKASSRESNNAEQKEEEEQESSTQKAQNEEEDHDQEEKKDDIIEEQPEVKEPTGQAQLLQPKVLPLEPEHLKNHLPHQESSDQSWNDCDSIGRDFQSCPSIGDMSFASCPSIQTEQSIGPAE
jgi:hypothetical protein